MRRASSTSDALRQMLAGTGYRAFQTGPSSFRIERISPPQKRRTRPFEPSGLPASPDSEIVVTALKRPERLSTLPATIQVVGPDHLRSATGLSGTSELVRELPSLSMSGMGSGRNRLFLRGIGDGPLNGFNQGSVAILLDEARLNYDAPDPDWALIDIQDVEVLEGPQGPLYGTGALGGIVKVSTNRPELSHSSASFHAGLSLNEQRDLSNSQSAVVNLPLLHGELALRAVGYRQSQAGWIDNVGRKNDANREQLSGARLSIRWSPAERWTVDFTGAVQNRKSRDSQYVDGDLGSLRRPDRLPEPRDLDAKVAMLTVKGPLGPVELTSVTSLSRQEASGLYDATPLAAVLGTTGQTTVNDDRIYRLFDQEIRLASESGDLQWLGGVSLIKATTRASTVASGSLETVRLLTLRRSITEAAVFGEVTYAVTPALSLGTGARIFSASVDDDGSEGKSARMHGLHRIRGAGDVTLTWKPDPNATFFLRGATAYRPGGTNVEPEATEADYEPDELAGVELGSRVRLTSALAFTATLFASRWQHVQADQLLENGLVATVNAGNGSNIGAEADVRANLGSDFFLTGALLVQSARLDAAIGALRIEDRRLPAVPQAASRLQLGRRFQIGKWDVLADLGLRYSGATHLSFDPALDRRTPPHTTVDASLGMSRRGWNLTLVGENLTDSRADIFAFGNPFRVRNQPQRTPARPRTIGLSITRNF